MRPATASNEPTARTPLVIAAVAVIAIAAAGGGVYYWKYMRASPESAASTAQEAPVEAPAAVTPEPMAAAEPTLQEPIAQEPMSQEPLLLEQSASEPPSVESSATVARDAASAEAAVSPTVPTAPLPPPPVAPAGLQPEIATRITAMLNQGQAYKQQLQYDKAIATAESVLMIDPGNRDAKRLVKEAKEGQQAALNSIEID